MRWKRLFIAPNIFGEYLKSFFHCFLKAWIKLNWPFGLKCEKINKIFNNCRPKRSVFFCFFLWFPHYFTVITVWFTEVNVWKRTAYATKRYDVCCQRCCIVWLCKNSSLSLTFSNKSFSIFCIFLVWNCFLKTVVKKIVFFYIKLKLLHGAYIHCTYVRVHITYIAYYICYMCL